MQRPWIVVDVEADGPAPGLYSMVCFGAVLIGEDLDNTFYGRCAPITDTYDPESLAISGFSREQHEGFKPPRDTMLQFANWLKRIAPYGAVFVSDNPAFDFAFINYYFHRFTGENPFGFSARRIGDLYCGMKGDIRASWKHLRETVHDHNPVNDAKGNAEALMKMFAKGLKRGGSQ